MQSAEKVDVVVLGAGFMGTAAAMKLAQQEDVNRVVQLDRLSEQQMAQENSSKGYDKFEGRRGIRPYDKGVENIELIRTTLAFMEEMEAKYGVEILSGRDTPYIMMEPQANRETLEHRQQQLREAHDAMTPEEQVKFERGLYEMMRMQDVLAQPGMRAVPQGYDFLNTLESVRCNIKPFYDAMVNEMAENGKAERRFGLEITDYYKLENGPHVITYNDGSMVETNRLVVAAGAEESKVLAELKALHDAHLEKEDVAGLEAAQPMPERFQPENCARIPQMTANFIFKEGEGQEVPTIYMMDVDEQIPGVKDAKSELGFYAFAVQNEQGQWGVKMGYDPMRNIADYSPDLNRILPKFFDVLVAVKMADRSLHLQDLPTLDGMIGAIHVRESAENRPLTEAEQVLMKQFAEELDMIVDHAHRIYDLEGKVERVETNLCAYGTDATMKPCAGKIGMYGIEACTHGIGQGLMSALGMAEIVSGERTPEKGSPFRADTQPTPEQVRAFRESYQPGAEIPKSTHQEEARFMTAPELAQEIAANAMLGALAASQVVGQRNVRY